MPSAALTTAYQQARDTHAESITTLVPLLIRMTMESIDEVLPGAHKIELEGRINEDWIPTLRIQRVLDQHGRVLFDIGFGHHDRRVEDAVDDVNTEYLDLLLDLTGDDYMDSKSLDWSDAETA